jgi:hypothetical protein
MASCTSIFRKFSMPHRVLLPYSRFFRYVNVRWNWIAFPAALILLALVFLVMTIFQNRRNGAMLWKSNSLANFYHPLTKDGRNALQSGKTAEEAEQIAESMKVQWKQTDSGYRLVQQREV